MTAPRAAALHHGAYWTEAIGLGVLTNPFGPVAILHTKGGPLPYTGTPVPVTSPAPPSSRMARRYGQQRHESTIGSVFQRALNCLM